MFPEYVPTPDKIRAAHAFSAAHAAQHYADESASCWDDDPKRYGQIQGRRVVYNDALGNWIPEATAAEFDELVESAEGAATDAAPAEPIAAADEAPQRRVVDVAQLKPTIAMGFDVIPIKKWDARDKDRFLGKAPRDNRWVTQRYERGEILDWIKEGGNVGVRLRPTEIVIDVDPKHPDADGRTAEMLIDELELELGIDLSECPVVQTGSGGWHMYLEKDPNTRVRNSTELFGGAIEFKSYGRQVLAPGSKHPNANYYQWVRGAGAKVPIAPGPLMAMIAKPELPKHERTEGEALSDDVLEQCLSQLDATKFQDYEKWRNLMFSVHYACGGSESGREIFIKWSTSDPKYAGAREAIDTFWEYASDNRSDARTEKTLFWYVSEPGLTVSGKPGHVPYDVEKEFPDEIEQPKVPAGEEPAADLPRFERNGGGKIKHTVAENVVRACRYLGISIRTDVFAEKSYVSDPSGVLLRHFGVADGSVLDDARVEQIGLAVTREVRAWTGDPSYRTIARAFTGLTTEYHPVLAYLNGLPKWDGVERIDRWLVTYGGAEDTPYVLAVSPLPLIAAVRRVRQPGCKFDELLTLEAPQGKNKSSAIKALCPDESWFSDALPIGADAKEVIEQTVGIWLAEYAELAGMQRRDVERVKSFLSRSFDAARAAYGRISRRRLRHFVPFATTNDESYLSDVTGNRRYWPVKIREFDVEALKRDRDLLWAEAAHRETAEESIRLDRRYWTLAAAEQEKRRSRDRWETALEEKLGAKEDPDRRDGRITGRDCWYLVGRDDVGRSAPSDDLRLGKAMRALGFEKYPFRIEGKKTNGYARAPEGWTKGFAVLGQIRVERDPSGRPSDATVRYVERDSD